jgi:hypothetical protein
LHPRSPPVSPTADSNPVPARKIATDGGDMKARILTTLTVLAALAATIGAGFADGR